MFALVVCLITSTGVEMSCKIVDPALTIYSTQEACQAARRIYPTRPTTTYHCWRKGIAGWERGRP